MFMYVELDSDLINISKQENDYCCGKIDMYLWERSFVLFQDLFYNLYFSLFVCQLFDTDNHLNKKHSDYIFTTEGHIVPISRKWRQTPWDEQSDLNFYSEEKGRRKNGGDAKTKQVDTSTGESSTPVVVTSDSALNSTFSVSIIMIKMYMQNIDK